MSNINVLKIGCGRYIQGKGAIKEAPAIIKNFSDNVLVIGGPITTNLIFPALGEELENKGIRYKIIKHPGQCSRNYAKKYADMAVSENFGAIVGIGGGKCLDLAKAVSFFSKLPVVNIPTSVATCAAVSAVSIMYTDDGKCDGNILMDRETDAVIVDSGIITESPKRLFAAGIFDSLAKLPEVLNGVKKINLDDRPLLSYIAYINSGVVSEFLLKNGKEVYNSPGSSDKLEDLILINLLQTSLVGGFSSGLKQLALAHGLYDVARTLFYKNTGDILHGEIVGAGIPVQMAFNGNSQSEINILRNLLIEMNVPTRLEEINIEPSKENISRIREFLINSCSINTGDIQRLELSLEQLL